MIRTTNDGGPDGERGDGDTGGVGDAIREWVEPPMGHQLLVGTLKSCDVNQPFLFLLHRRLVLLVDPVGPAVVARIHV